MEKKRAVGVKILWFVSGLLIPTLFLLLPQVVSYLVNPLGKAIEANSLPFFLITSSILVSFFLIPIITIVMAVKVRGQNKALSNGLWISVIIILTLICLSLFIPRYYFKYF